MPQIEKTALVMYSTKEMFDLVNDIQAYPEFLPHCANAKIISQQAHKVEAGLEIAKAGVRKWFTTANHLSEDKNSIQMQLLDGPFKYLQGQWQFTALDENACKVSLTLDFEFSNKLVALAFGKIFNEVAKNMVGAFTQRAKLVYGARV